jgi:outer membrane protein insertion porin family
MLRRITWLVLIILMVMAPTCYAQSETRVMVLPFEVNALQDLAYLQAEVPKIIEKNLSAEGAVIVEPPIQSVLTDPVQIRKWGLNMALISSFGAV